MVSGNKCRTKLMEITIATLNGVLGCPKAQSRAKMVCTLVWPITRRWYESQTKKKADRERKESRGIRCWRRALWGPRASRRMNEWVSGQVKLETSLEAKMTEPKLT